MKADTKDKQVRRAEDNDILDLLPPEIANAVDEIGYALLRRNGYDTDGALDSDRVQKKLSRELRKRGQRLEYSLYPAVSGYVVLRFSLKEGDRIIDKSEGIKFLPHRAEREDK